MCKHDGVGAVGGGDGERHVGGEVGGQGFCEPVAVDCDAGVGLKDLVDGDVEPLVVMNLCSVICSFLSCQCCF